MACILSLCVWWSYRTVQNQFIQPQAILVLGGSTPLLEREKFTAKLAHQYPNIPIWISGGSPPQYTKKIFANAGVDLQRLNLDYEAVDTVTNFTTLVDELRSRGIKSVYLITSDFHMRRACIVGEIVLGSRGMNFKPVSVPSEHSPEPIQKSIRDGVRAVIWVATGYTGTDHAKNKR
ncbi:MAG: YdcF family protein [Cuspidothrix sp.]